MGERDERLEAIYNHPSMAKHMHHGLNTKTKYGFIARGRIIPGGVFKADIRMRPDLYICANCRDPFVVTRTDIYCGTCSPAQLTGLRQGKPSSPRPEAAPPMPRIVEEPEELPPPPDLTELKVPPPRYPLTQLELGPRQGIILKTLKDNDIMFVDQVEDLGFLGLVKVSGIGEKTANDILDAIRLLEI